jgi:predicted metal-dependent phosphoesterase TrpH
MPLLKLDLHVHTQVSPDAHTRINDLPMIIRSKGLDGVAVTEHDRFDPPTFDDVIILPGVEVSSADGHIIALGAREAIPSRLSADETIQKIHNQGAIAIIPHPYDPVCECVRISRLRGKPDAVETYNADALSFIFSNWLAKRDAHRFGLPEVGGSDSHIPESIGDCYTVVDSPTRAVSDILNAIRAGNVHPEGHATSLMNKWRKLSFKFR